MRISFLDGVLSLGTHYSSLNACYYFEKLASNFSHWNEINAFFLLSYCLTVGYVRNCCRLKRKSLYLHIERQVGGCLVSELLKHHMSPGAGPVDLSKQLSYWLPILVASVFEWFKFFKEVYCLLTISSIFLVRSLINLP